MRGADQGTPVKGHRVPDFLIVGAAKSGTTSLSHYLSEHPAIEIVSNRLEYFGEFSNPSIGRLAEEEYLHYFSEIPQQIRAGEKSVSYLYSELAPIQINKMNPDMKIIMILRDPTERAYSDFWNQRRKRVEKLSFEEALSVEAERLRNNARFELHYLNYGLYSEKVKRYIEMFGKENIGIFLFEDLNISPSWVCRECFKLLGVNEEFTPAKFNIYCAGGEDKFHPIAGFLYFFARRSWAVSLVRRFIPKRVKVGITSWMNNSSMKLGYPKMNFETEEKVREFFYEDVKVLESIIDRDLSSWLSRKYQDIDEPASSY
jgi:hypothetical protein